MAVNHAALMFLKTVAGRGSTCVLIRVYRWCQVFPDLCIPYHMNRGVAITKMPTAIVKVYTRDGFIIAGDGRDRSVSTGVVRSDDRQKVFPIENHDRTLAWTIQGTATRFNADTGEAYLDIVGTCKKLIEDMADRKSRHDLNWYASKLKTPIREALQSSVEICGPFTDIKSARVFICQISLFGYYRGIASESCILFTHENDKVLNPQIFNADPSDDPVEAKGSEEVANALFNTTSPQFSKFRTKAITERITDRKRFDSLTLAEGKEIAKNYIRACESDEGLRLDEESCSGIGGTITFAEITPTGIIWSKDPP